MDDLKFVKAVALMSGSLSMRARWSDSGFATLIVMERKTTTKKGITQETSFYLSNEKLTEDKSDPGRELFEAIRGHWRVESDNWVRDVTFQEDSVRTNSGNQAPDFSRHLFVLWRSLNSQKPQA